MRKVRRTYWFMPIILVLSLIAVFVVGGGGKLFMSFIPVLSGTDRSINAKGGACTSNYQGPAFGGNVVVDTGQVVCSDLISFGGTVAIKGEVRGNVVVFGGNVIVDGNVAGDINLYGGIATLQSGSHVHGDIHLYGGRWIRSNDAQLDGSVIDRTQRLDWMFADQGGFAFPFLSILTWIALGLLVTWLLPEHAMFVRTTIATRARRSLVLGLLSALLAPALLIVLIALILPIPLAIIVALGFIAAWALGTIAMGWLVGEYIVRALAPHKNTRPVQVIVGLVLLVLVGALPYIGWLISIGVGLLGLGAVLLSRFGTRLYGQPKQPLSL